MAKKTPRPGSDANPSQQQYENTTANAIASLESALTKEADSSRQQEKWENKWDKIIQIATLVFVIATTVGIFYQAHILNSTDKTIHQTMINGQRAYLGVALKLDGQKFSLITENYGQTPAQNVKLFSNWKILPTGEYLPEDFTYSDTEICPAGERKNSAIIFPRLPVSTENLICATMMVAFQKAIAGRENIFFYGSVEYFDIFDKPRHTDFCFLITEPFAIFCKNHNRVY